MQIRRRWMWELIREKGTMHTAEIALAVNRHFKSTICRASYNKELKIMREHPVKFLDHVMKSIKGSKYIFYTVPEGAEYQVINTSEPQRAKADNKKTFADLGAASKWFGYVPVTAKKHQAPTGLGACQTQEKRKELYGKNGVYFLDLRPYGMDRAGLTGDRGMGIGTSFQQADW